MKNVRIWLLFVLIGLVACEEKKKENEEIGDSVEEGTNDEDWSYEGDSNELPLDRQLDTLRFAIDSLKKAAFASEETKFDAGEKLIDEFRQSIEGENADQLATTEEHLKEMQLAVYNKANLDNEEVMLAYDDANERFIVSLNKLVEGTEDFSRHARAKLLLKDIANANEADFMIRKTHNEKVNEFNKLLRKKKDKIRALPEKYQGLKPYVLFYGEPAS